MKCLTVGKENPWSPPPIERHQVEGWGCNSIVKNFDPELLMYKKTAGAKIRRHWRKSSPMTSPSWKCILWEGTRAWHYYHCYAVLTLGAWRGCPLRGQTSSWMKQMQTHTPNHWTKVGDCYGPIRGWIDKAEGENDPRGRPAVSIYPDPHTRD